MLKRPSIETLKANRLFIMFGLFMILLIVLAWWVAERLMDHIDQNMPGL